MDSTLPAVAEELLKEIKKAFQETSHVPDDLLLGSLEAQANSTPATVPATSARVLLLALLFCRRVRASCANIYLLSTSVGPWEPASNSLSLRSSSRASYWLKKRMSDEGFGSHVDGLSV
ncbi:zinc finger SWIM domain-containing protein 7 isoform 2-T2 [Porphyrio hochstetteri]